MKLSMIFLIVTAIAVTNAVRSGIDDENSIQHTDDKLFKIINFVCQDKKLDYETIKKTLNDPMAYEESIHEISEKTSKKLKMLYCPDKSYKTVNQYIAHSNMKHTKTSNCAIQSTLLQWTMSDKVDCEEINDYLKTVHIPEGSVILPSQEDAQNCVLGRGVLI